MSAVTPVDAVANPNDTSQGYVLWSNGRIDVLGSATPITDIGGMDDWPARFDPPGVAIAITNWTTGAGWVLDYRGGFNPINGATHVNVTGTAMTGIPITDNPRTKKYVDWAWDPAGNGQGYVLTGYGQILPFGGAAAPTRTGTRWGTQQAKKLKMRFSPSKLAVTADRYGKLYGDFGATPGTAASTWGTPKTDALRDFAVLDWATNPHSGYLLGPDGAMHVFGTRSRPFGWPFSKGGDLARTLTVLSASNPESFREVWAGGQVHEFISSTPPTVIAGAGQSEVQTVTITGTPTGGTFTLTYSGQTTGTIAFNATATTVQTALRALSNIGSTGVNVTGGPGPGTPWLVAFAGALADTDVALMTTASSLTGGTSPTVSAATTTEGVTASPANTVTNSTRPDLRWEYSDPQGDEQAGWQVMVFTQAFVDAHSMTDPLAWVSSALVALEGVDRNARGVECPVDFANGTYRQYVRAKDTADQWSAWANRGWTQNVAAPPTPTTFTATANQTAFTVALSVSTSAGTADLVRFEASDDGGTTWEPVRGAEAVPRITTTTATDYDAPLGFARMYRARTYAINPRVLSAASNTATTTLTKLTYLLTVVDDPTLGGEISAQEPVEWIRPVSVGIFQGIGADYPTVLRDGRPKGRRNTLHVICETKAQWDRLEAVANSVSTLVYRDPFGEVVYCELAGDWDRTQLVPLQYMHSTNLPLIEVEPPIASV